ncbi:uncharacterized protein PFLUO_LOCUS2198 [Penicillium psychrofluorescens]|uniref:uncharacterized protein n=1 Tax=Penicillium psychrofluorescens TaxID=3158075 RepID=UPI003CCD1782
MTSVCTDSVQIAIGIASMSPHDETVAATPSLMQDLPTGYAVRTFSRFKRLKAEAEEILQRLHENEDDGNQWLVVLGLSASSIDKLDNDHGCLGIDYRFQWEGTAGLIKVVPSGKHDMTTDKTTRVIDMHLNTMGITDPDDRQWIATTTHKPTSTKGKEGDQGFLPPSRLIPVMQPGWPTLVIETGVSESLPRLRADAKWWFAASSGDVRIVLVVSIKKTKVEFEKWQLAPPNAPRPLTRQYIDNLRLGNQVPPLFQQPATTQQAYSALEVDVYVDDVVGEPMILPFHALYDRPPGPGEEDVVLGAADFRKITRMAFV